MTLLLSLLTFSAFAQIQPHANLTTINMKPAQFMMADEDIVNILPVLPVTVIQTAQMQILDTNDQNPATDIQLAEVSINQVKAYEFSIEGRKLILDITSERVDTCNTKIITAVDANNTAKLELADNTNRFCKDIVENTWVASVKADNLNYELAGLPHN